MKRDVDKRTSLLLLLGPVLVHTYAVVNGGDFTAGHLSELSQQVQHLQGGHEEHEVGQGEEHHHLPVRLLVHILADQHAVVVRFAEVPQDLHG